MEELLTILFGDRINRARSKVKDAVDDYARKHAEMQYHQFLHFYHQDEALKTDHKIHWWAYAGHMQKAADHAEKMKQWDERAKDAKAKLEAKTLKLVTITNSQPKEPDSQID